MTLILSILNDQTVQAITIIALVVGLVDWGYAVLKAVSGRDFRLDLVAEYLTGHALLRLVPIVLLAFLGAAVGNALSSVTEPPVALQGIAVSATLAAWAGLLAYAGETVASLKETREFYR